MFELQRLIAPFTLSTTATWSARRTPARHRTSIRGRTRRLPTCERLEVRRLLVVEGDVFNVTRTVDTSGLVGDISSTVRWGDGTESAAAVETSGAEGRVRIRFEYGDDPFFSGANTSRRSLLQIAADAITNHFDDDLDAIEPNATNRGWSAVLAADPRTGQTQRINNLAVNANEIVVFAGSRELGVNANGDHILGLGGPGGFEFSTVEPVPQDVLDQIIAFRDTVLTRGEAGTTGANPTDQGLWGGAISFDTTTNWHFGVSDAGLDSDESDFITVASHELAHLLGFGVTFDGAATSVWESLSRTGVFTGAQAKLVNSGQNVPLDSNRGHYAREFEDAVPPPLMIPKIDAGNRVLLAPLDLAALDDLGWDVLSARATVTASHQYAANGVYPVEIVVKGSRFGEIVETFSANVTNVVALPALSLELDKISIAENDGNGAATLTVRRAGPAIGSDQTITLESSDTSEATIPVAVVIPADETSATVSVQAVDDTLLDGQQIVALSASATGLHPAAIDLIVADHETLSAFFTKDIVYEDSLDGVHLIIARSTTDNGQPLEVTVTGGFPGQLELPGALTIPADTVGLETRLQPSNDEDGEPTVVITFNFSAAGFVGDNASITLLDDEPPFFQNPVDRFDVNNMNGVTAADALRVIEELGRRGGAAELNPIIEQTNGTFLDPNGDYRVSALDALNIINELSRRELDRSSGEAEAVWGSLVLPSASDHQDDEEDLRSLWWSAFVIIG